MTDNLYYAKGLEVWKHPVKTKTGEGTNISIGFQVCTVTDIIGEDGAITVACLLDSAERSQEPPDVSAKQPMVWPTNSERDARLIAGYFFDHWVEWPESEKALWIDQEWKRFEPEALTNAPAFEPTPSPQLPRFDVRAFTAENVARCTAPNGFNHALDLWSLSDWMTATLGELGEAANVLKKLNRVRDGIVGNKETPEDLVSMLADEIADAYIYMDLFAVAAGIDLPAAVRAKFDRTSAKIGYQPATSIEEPPCGETSAS